MLASKLKAHFQVRGALPRDPAWLPVSRIMATVNTSQLRARAAIAASQKSKTIAAAQVGISLRYLRCCGCIANAAFDGGVTRRSMPCGRQLELPQRRAVEFL